MKWEEVSLEFAPIDIIDGDRGVNYPKSEEFFDLEYCLFLNTGNVTLTGFDFSKNQFINQEKDSKLRKGKLKRADLVLTTRGTLGNVGFYAETIPFENLRINSGMVIIRVIDTSNIYPKYIYYSIRNSDFQNQISNSRSGSAQPQIPIGTLKKLKIPLPLLPTQQKIASILSAYDDLIENNLKRIRLLEEAAQHLYREWFIKFRFPGWEEVQMVDGLPEEWERIKIGEVCETIGGGTPSTKEPKFWDGGEIIWFSPTDLSKSSSLVLLDSATKITEDGLKNSSAKLLPPRTILMSSRATIGLFGIISKQCSTIQGFISIIPREEHFRYYFLFNLINRKQEIINNANGSTFKEINKKNFREMDIVMPSANQAKSFYAFAETFLNQIENLEKQNQKLKAARDLLLPRLMSGIIEI